MIGTDIANLLKFAMLNQFMATCESPNESDSTGLGIRELGATFCTPETVEASLQLARNVLLDIGVDAEVVHRRMAEQRLIETA